MFKARITTKTCDAKENSWSPDNMDEIAMKPVKNFNDRRTSWTRSITSRRFLRRTVSSVEIERKKEKGKGGRGKKKKRKEKEETSGTGRIDSRLTGRHAMLIIYRGDS